MKHRISLFVIALVVSTRFALSSEPQDEIRATFEKFVAAQNAHDLKALEPLLLDSPQFLWITRGTPVWGRADALKRFEGLYTGTWHLEPEWNEFRVVVLQPEMAQLFVPIVFSIGPAGQAAQEARFLMNQTLVKVGNAWRVASILPIPAPAPAGETSK